MNTSVVLGLAIGLVCVFVAFVYRITSVMKDTKNTIAQADEITNRRIDSFGDLYNDSLLNLTRRVEKLEESKICILDTGTDEEGKTSLYAITKVGYSTIVVSLTEDEVAVLNSFIDWAALEDDFIAEKIDEHFIPEDWRNKK